MSSSDKKLKDLEDKLAASTKQVEKFKDNNAISMEAIKKLNTELVAQKKKVEVLKKATGEMSSDDKVCANTKRELKAVVEENDDLVADMKMVNQKHRQTITELTETKNKAVKDLEAQIAKTSAGDRLNATLQVKLVKVKQEYSECVSKENDLNTALSKCEKTVKQLMRNREKLTRKVEQMTLEATKKESTFKNKLKKQASVVRTLKDTRPIVMNRINNTSEKVVLAAETIKITIANIDVKNPASGVIAVAFKGRDNLVLKRTLRFSGNGSLNVKDAAGKVTAANLVKGVDVVKSLGDDPLPVRVRKTPLLRNGWSFEFTAPPQGGVFTSVSIGVENQNEWYGLSGIQILSKLPTKRPKLIPKKITRSMPSLKKPVAASRTGSAPTIINPRFKR